MFTRALLIAVCITVLFAPPARSHPLGNSQERVSLPPLMQSGGLEQLDDTPSPPVSVPLTIEQVRQCDLHSRIYGAADYVDRRRTLRITAIATAPSGCEAIVVMGITLAPQYRAGANRQATTIGQPVTVPDITPRPEDPREPGSYPSLPGEPEIRRRVVVTTIRLTKRLNVKRAARFGLLSTGVKTWKVTSALDPKTGKDVRIRSPRPATTTEWASRWAFAPAVHTTARRKMTRTKDPYRYFKRCDVQAFLGMNGRKRKKHAYATWVSGPDAYLSAAVVRFRRGARPCNPRVLLDVQTPRGDRIAYVSSPDDYAGNWARVRGLRLPNGSEIVGVMFLGRKPR